MRDKFILWEFVPEVVEHYEKEIITPDIDYLNIAEKVFKEHIKEDIEDKDNHYYFEYTLEEAIGSDIQDKVSFYICVDMLKAFFK